MEENVCDLIPRDQSAAVTAPLQHCDAGGVCVVGQGCVFSGGVWEENGLARLPPHRQQGFSRVPLQQRRAESPFHMTQLNMLSLMTQTDTEITEHIKTPRHHWYYFIK